MHRHEIEDRRVQKTLLQIFETDGRNDWEKGSGIPEKTQKGKAFSKENIDLMLKNNNCNEQKLEINVLVGINAYFGGTNTYQLTLAKKC